MSHMITATGLEYHFGLFAPATLRPVCIEDIAHQLSIINRFHGATSRPYSVAEHSLLVAYLAKKQELPPIVQLACLLHDAHEIYTNDLSSPAKHAVDRQASGCSAPWATFEAEHAHHVRQHFGLLTTFAAYRQTIRHLDLVALATERAALTKWRADTHAPWACLRDGQPDAIAPFCEGLITAFAEVTWSQWRVFFLNRFRTIREEVTQAAEVQLHDPAGQPGGAA